MTLEDLDRLKAVADQRTAPYQARLQSDPNSPSLPRFAELEHQARQAYEEALAQWDCWQAEQN